jgi:hypothetical protein
MLNMHTRHKRNFHETQQRLTGLFGPLDPLSDNDSSSEKCSDACECRNCRLSKRSRRRVSEPTAQSGKKGKILYQNRRASDSVLNSNAKRELSSEDSDPDSNVWPSPIRRKIITGRGKRQRRLAREERIRKEGCMHRIYQSRHWELDDGRRCVNGFRGRPDLTIKNRPVLPLDATPKAWIRILEEADYDFEEVRCVLDLQRLKF